MTKTSSHRRLFVAVLSFLLVTGCATRPDFRHEATQRPKKRKVGEKWHWFQNSFLRPPQELAHPDRIWARLAGHPKPAINVGKDGNPIGSVIWQDRDIRATTPEQAARGPDTDDGPRLPITFLKAKNHGTTHGFFGKDARNIRYLFKFDPDAYPEMVTRAEFIGSKLMFLLGYNVPEITIFKMRGTGTNFDGKECAAVKFVPGQICGPWSFRKHRDYREVRALKTASAWIDNTDIKAPNTLVTWQHGKQKVYLIDFGGSLGSHTYRPKRPQEGWEYTVDVRARFFDILTLGLLPKPYDKNAKPFSPAVGLFDANFDPVTWRPNYTVVPFYDLTVEDATWMAKRIASVSDEQIRSVVAAAHYSRKKDEDYVVKVLIERREVIRKTYLSADN